MFQRCEFSILLSGADNFKIVFLLQALIKKQQGNRIGFLMNYSVKKKRIIIYIRNNIPYNQAW